MRCAGILLAVSWTVSSALAAPGAEVRSLSNAALINVTEADLNLLLRDAFHAEGASKMTGTRALAGRALHDLRYSADLSDPVLELQDAGQARLSLDILRADVHVGRIEKRIWRRNASCEGAGFRIEDGHPLGVELSLRFAVEHDGLQIVPEGVELRNAAELRLDRPTRCTNAPLPTWLLWRMGKGRLRRQVDRLDDVILTRARAGASRIEGRGGLLGHSLDLLAGNRSADAGKLRIGPTAVDTSRGSLFVTLSASDGAPPSGSRAPSWVDELAGESFLALSEPLINEIVRRELAEREEHARTPKGDLRKLFRSSAVYALAPGLRGFETEKQLALRFRLAAPPEIRFDTLAGPAREGEMEPAVIRVGLDGLEVDLVDLSPAEPHVVGTLVVSARLTVLPYANLLGGLSLEPLENEWSVSSRGIEFDDDALEATLQEIVFGELFETSYEPVARETRVGSTRLSPRFFTRRGEHLVIALAHGGADIVASTGTRAD